jgi:hypothetical protein
MKKSLETTIRLTAATAVLWSLSACQPRKSFSDPNLDKQQSPISSPTDSIINTTPTDIIHRSLATIKPKTIITPIPTLTPTSTETPLPTPRPPYEINGVILNNPEIPTQVTLTLENGTIFSFNTAFITDPDSTKLNKLCPPGENKTCTYLTDGLTFIFPHSGRDFFNQPLEFEAIREYIEGPANKPLSQKETNQRLASLINATLYFAQPNNVNASATLTAAIRIAPDHVQEFIRNFADAPSVAGKLNPKANVALSESKFFSISCGRPKPGESNPQNYPNYAASRLLFSFRPTL